MLLYQHVKIKLPGTGPEDIVDGNLKLILGMVSIFTCDIRFLYYS